MCLDPVLERWQSFLFTIFAYLRENCTYTDRTGYFNVNFIGCHLAACVRGVQKCSFVRLSTGPLCCTNCDTASASLGCVVCCPQASVVSCVYATVTMFSCSVHTARDSCEL